MSLLTVSVVHEVINNIIHTIILFFIYLRFNIENRYEKEIHSTCVFLFLFIVFFYKKQIISK